MTKDAAELKVAVLNAGDPDWFCPLINNTCNKKCWCFVRSRVRGWNKDGKSSYSAGFEENEFDATDPFCSNTMFTRECSHQ